MKLSNLWWSLRAALMFFFGVVPAIVLLALLLIFMPLAAILPDMVLFFGVVAALALLGIVGLWAATFHDEQESVLPNAVTIPCVLVGLVPAVVYSFGIAPEAIENGGFALLVTALLIGPVACALYFVLEQGVVSVRSHRGASNNNLERDPAKPRTSG
jgi:hypothetical protein